MATARWATVVCSQSSRRRFNYVGTGHTKLLKTLVLISVSLGIVMTISCTTDAQSVRWNLETTGKVPIVSSTCDIKGVQAPCGEVWWLDSSGEKHYKTWPISSDCYVNSRIGYDLPDSCR